MRRLLPAFFLLVLVMVHVVSLGRASTGWKMLPKGEGDDYAIPPSILKITALEFDGLASDFLFLKSLVFLGSTFERKERPRIKEWEWKWVYGVLDASTGLDPYFLDPYYVANAFLTWEGGMARETNRLLERGSRFRDWDWRLPFYIGFNKFYFLNENEEASVFLMEAARRPESSPLLVSLASKLAFKERRTENAILFLEEMINKTEDELLRKDFENRLEAYRGIYALEQAVRVFQQRFKRAPRNIQELVAWHIITAIPKDPYGGKFYIDGQGVVKTTSEYLLMPYLKK